MKHKRQEWKNRNAQPIINNEIDCVVIENVPCSQVDIWNFLEKSFTSVFRSPIEKL